MSSGQEKAPTFPWIELGRVFATLGVIAFHIRGMPYHQVTYTGLIYFTITLVVFCVSPSQPPQILRLVSKRAIRLLIPWSFWWIVYFGLSLATGRDSVASQVSTISGILAGPWLALWFLPWAFAASTLTYAVSPILRNLQFVISVSVLSALTITLLALAVFVRDRFSIIAPWAQWLHAAPSLPIGIAIASIRRDRGPIALVLFALPIVTACVALYRIDPGLFLPYSVALVIVTLALLHTGPLPASLKSASSLCFGVYLIHGLALALVNRTPLLSDSVIAIFGGASTLSFLGVYLLRKIPLAQRVL